MSLTVVIGIPLFGDGKEQFWNCVEKMRWHSARHGIDTVRQTMKCCYIHHNRNLIVVATQKHWQAASHILWLDTDVYFDPDLLLRLLVHKKSIVCTNYYRKGPPHLPVATSKDQEGVLRPVYRDPDRSGLELADGSGMGACLTRVRVFEKIKFPWFENLYEPPPPAIANNPEASQDLICGRILLGEDVYFFRKAKKAGFKVYCDFSIKIGHIGDYIYDWRDYERNQGNHPCQGGEVCRHGDQRDHK